MPGLLPPTAAAADTSAGAGEGELPKGLNEATLKQVLAFLANIDTQVSSEEVGDGVSISRVTARRYLDYLETIDLRPFMGSIFFIFKTR